MDSTKTVQIQPIPLDEVLEFVPPLPPNIFWDDFLASGEVTLLTSQWKLGKTTLLTGLIRAFGQGTPFLERATTPAKVWIVSEESILQWQRRLQDRRIGPHVQLLARPFAGKPTHQQWHDLIATACEALQRGQCDLLVIDPLASFLPGYVENDANRLIETLQPLHEFTSAGGTVLLLHHPKKDRAEDGKLARGSGALLGFVDVSMELTCPSKHPAECTVRKLAVRSRRSLSTTELRYTWEEGSNEFAVYHEHSPTILQLHWNALERVLNEHLGEISLEMIQRSWPEDTPVPSRSRLYELLKSAVEKKRIVRTGRGTRSDPYQYRLRKKSDDDHDDFVSRFEPLSELEPLT
jgi:AAA domain